MLSSHPMFIEIVKALALMLALCFVYSGLVRAVRLQGLASQVTAGLLFGCFCILGMLSPVVIVPGVYFDSRTIVLSMAALFGGPLVGSIALAMAVAWWLSVSALNTWACEVVMLLCVVLGLLYRQGRQCRRMHINGMTLLVLGILLHLMVFCSFFYTLPPDTWKHLYATVGVPFLFIFALGTVLMGLLLRDVENRVKTEHALKDSSARLQAIASSMPDVLMVLDAQGTFKEVLAAQPQALAVPAAQLLDRKIHDFLSAEMAQIGMQKIEKALASGQTQYMNYQLQTLSGLRAFEGRIKPLGTQVQGLPAVLFLARDITERMEAEGALRESELRFRSLLRDIPSISVQGYSADGTTIYWNKASEHLYGFTEKEALGRNLMDLIVPAPAHSLVRDEMRHMFATGISIPAGEVKLQRKNGSLVDVYSSHAYVEIAGQPPEMFCIDIDISRRKAAEEEARYLAFYDVLTRLPNRRLLIDRLQQVMASSERSGLQAAVLFLDLDNFKTLNDSRGHAVGDLLLLEVARRLQGCVRSEDTVARLGGDEFVVVMHNLNSTENASAAQVRTVGEEMLEVLRQPYDLAGQLYHMTVSMGATLLKDRHASIDEILKQADMAMYRAKDAGRNTLRFFDPDMQEAVNQRALLEAEMHKGLRESQFLLLYQAQVDDLGRVIGAEALVRWQHPVKGMVSPAVFIGLAEESGLILPLGHWVLQEAMRQQAQWRSDPALANLRMAINVSARQFRQNDFVAQVLQAIAYNGADPRCITLELTESLLLQDVEGVIDTMRILKSHGLGFSLDDFGTGYSSLNYLKRLPLDQIKIDQGFVRDALSNPSDAAIAYAIITLANKLGLGVIAEGVETAEQHGFLVSHGCRAFQGYLFGRPEPVQQLEQRTRSNSLASKNPELKN